MKPPYKEWRKKHRQKKLTVRQAFLEGAPANVLKAKNPIMAMVVHMADHPLEFMGGTS